jgi:hypothetical protein
MNRESVLFCTLALAVTAIVFVVGFRLATLPPDALEASRRPAPAEQLPDIDLGPGYGKVSVIELVAHYVENPPAASGTAAPAIPAVRRFGGC